MTTASSTSYRRDVDGLRALAVGSVVAYHAFPNLAKGGFIGVDIFFAISGFLISGIIFRALEEGAFSYADFYARRIKRIFPALIAVCASTLLVGWYVLLPDEFRQLGKHLAAGAGFVSNLALWGEAGYFDKAADTKPLLHLWSLGIEEQFYIVWPIVLGLVWRRRRGFLLVTAVIALASFAVNIATVAHNPVAAFYSPLSRFWELMAGGVLAYLVMHRPQSFVRGAELRSVAGAALFVAALLLLNKQSMFPGWWALLPTLGACLMISAGPQAWINRRLLGSPPLVWIGLISYPLYLWHWPILVFAAIINGKQLTPVERLAAVAAAVALAFLTYRYIEARFRHARTPRVPQGLGLALASIGVLGLVVLPGALAPRLKGDRISQVLTASYDWEYPPVTAEGHNFGSLRYFVLDGRPGAYTLFLGDSNMEQYGPRIDRVVHEGAGRVNGAILIGNQRECSLLRELMVGGSACQAGLQQLRSLIDEPRTRAVVFVASWAGFHDELLNDADRARFEALVRSIAQSRRVYIVLNMPSGPELAPASMFTGSRLGEITPKPMDALRFDMTAFQGRMRDIDAALRSVARNSGATVIDPVASLCPNQQCPVLDDHGTPLYLDSNHLTRTYASRSARYIDVTLDPEGVTRAASN